MGIKDAFKKIGKILNPATISINNSSTTISGNNISISGNGRIVVDGKDVTDQYNTTKKIEVVVTGDAGVVNVNAGNVTIEGNVLEDVKVDAGNITIKGDVHRDVTVDCGNIKCNTVKGNSTINM